MGALTVGVSNPPDLVKKVQGLINLAYNQSLLPESGSYDDATADAVSRFQRDSKLPSSGKTDDKTLAVLYWASKTPIRQLTYNGRTFSLNDPEYKQVSARLIKKAEAQTRWYVNMASGVAGLWKEHNSVRGDNTFWAFVLDQATGAKFPSQSDVDAVVKAADAIASAAKSDDYQAYEKAIDAGSEKIRALNAAMNQYQEELFTGGAKLVEELEQIKEGCVVTLEISAAIATGGSSMAVTAAVMGGVGSYKALLGEIDKASVKSDVKFEDAFAHIIQQGLIDATVGAIMKGHGDALAKSVAEKVAGKYLKEVAGECIAEFVEHAIEGGAKKVMEDGLKDLAKAFNPKEKMTVGEFMENAAKNFAKGAFLGQVDALLGGVTKNAAKLFSAKDFEGLGKVAIDKALKEGGLKVIEVAYEKYVGEALKAAHGEPAKIQPELKKRIVDDPAVQKWFDDYGKKQEKK